MLKQMKEVMPGANFSAVLPGKCNAKCDFCFWVRSRIESPMYAQQLGWYLREMNIKKISITGGEPTLSPVFDDVIEVLRDLDIRVILTTNGAKIIEKMDVIDGVVDHINLSRHAISDNSNCEIFRTGSVPATTEVKEICQRSNNIHIDVTLNKVVSSNYDSHNKFHEFIQFAKLCGASAVAVRKDHQSESLEETPVEENLGAKRVSSSCPVCVTNSYIISGLPVYFMASLSEPGDVVPYIYEFIYHPNGTLTEDWAGKKPVLFGIPEVSFEEAFNKCAEKLDRAGLDDKEPGTRESKAIKKLINTALKVAENVRSPGGSCGRPFSGRGRC